MKKPPYRRFDQHLFDRQQEIDRLFEVPARFQRVRSGSAHIVCPALLVYDTEFVGGVVGDNANGLVFYVSQRDLIARLDRKRSHASSSRLSFPVSQ
jgi:hypothetical protein